MANIKFEAGFNDCKFNFEGKCVSPNLIGNKGQKISELGYVWTSKCNCVFTQIGTQICGAYVQERLY